MIYHIVRERDGVRDIIILKKIMYRYFASTTSGGGN